MGRQSIQINLLAERLEQWTIVDGGISAALKQVEEVAKIKLPDLNTKDVKQAMEMVKGTARSMGVDIVG